jgi:hypothetical protein
MALKRITDLAVATTLAGSELLEISQLSASVTITATTISAAAADNSYNDSGSGFVTAGFAVGDRVQVSGFTGNTANNIQIGVITALTTGKMTIGGTDGDVIVDDAAGESVTISKWVSRRVSAADLLNDIQPVAFLGVYASDGALSAAHPVGTSGQYAFVDAGASSDPLIYIWDDDTNDWVASGGSGSPGALNFIDLLDVPATYAGQDLKFLRVNATEDGLEFIVPTVGSLVDGPGSFVGNELYTVKVNSLGTALEYVDDRADRVTETGTTRNLADTDLVGNVIITCTNASGCAITIPDTLVGTEPCIVRRASGAGPVTFVAGGTTTIHMPAGLTDVVEDGTVFVDPQGSDVYYIDGRLE